MPDISMCTNSLCPNASHCYRVQATPSHWQSWTPFEYKIGVDGVECEHYMPMYEITSSSTAKE